MFGPLSSSDGGMANERTVNGPYKEPRVKDGSKGLAWRDFF